MRQEKRAFKFRFYPTLEQEASLLRSIGATRFVWNWGLNLRTKAWKERGERVSSVDLINLLPKLKLEKETVWLSEISSAVLQQVLRDLDQAFLNYFASLKGTREGAKVLYPRFKSRATARKSLRYVRTAFRFKDGELFLAKMEDSLNIVWSRPLPEGKVPSSITVSCDAAGRWFASILVEDDIAQLEPTGSVLRSVGIDLGLKNFAVFSDGTIIEHPKLLKKSAARLAQYQRRLSRTKPGSKNRAKARIKFARAHASIADQRKDFNHKLSTYIVQNYDIITIEDLPTKNLMRNHQLAKGIADSGWSSIRTMLTYKSYWYGRELIVISRWFPSTQLCSTPNCGWRNTQLKLSDRTWTCFACGTLHDRDHNASKNIDAEGLSVLSKRNLAKNVCFDVSKNMSGEVRPKATVPVASRKTRHSHVNQKPNAIERLHVVA